MNFAAGSGEAAIEQARLEAAAEETTRSAAASRTQSKDSSSLIMLSEMSQAPRQPGVCIVARACAVRSIDGAASAGALQLRALLLYPWCTRLRLRPLIGPPLAPGGIRRTGWRGASCN